MNLKGFDSQPVRFSRVYEIQLSEPPDSAEMSAEIRMNISNALARLTGMLEENGCVLIGHIKAYLDAGPDGGIFFSITAFGREPQCRGEMRADVSSARLILNVIVFGVDEETVGRIAEVCFKEIQGKDDGGRKDGGR